MRIAFLTEAVLAARRERCFRSTPVYAAYASVSSEELGRLEGKIGNVVPASLREWLLTVGYGDIDDALSFREAWFFPIEKGPLQGGATFAQDILGNFYAFDALGAIYFLSRSKPACALIADDFCAFIEELIRRDYRLSDWMDALDARRHTW